MFLGGDATGTTRLPQTFLSASCACLAGIGLPNYARLRIIKRKYAGQRRVERRRIYTSRLTRDRNIAISESHVVDALSSSVFRGFHHVGQVSKAAVARETV